DQELYDALVRNEYCYILTSRQMGKSSLMIRTAVRLREAGIRVAVLDLTAIGQNLTPEQWYDGLLQRLAQQIDLEEALEAFWISKERFGPLQRFMAALEEVVLSEREAGVGYRVSGVEEEGERRKGNRKSKIENTTPDTRPPTPADVDRICADLFLSMQARER